MSSKDKILAVSRELFYRNGYLGTSVDDIIAQAGVSKSNFYYHFKSKEDLGLDVLAQRGDELKALLNQTLCNTEITQIERLAQFLSFLVNAQDERYERGGCPFGNLVAEMAEHSERFRCHLSGMFESLNETLIDLMVSGQQSGQFRRDVGAEDMAALVLHTTQGMLLMAKCHKRLEDLRRTAGLLVRLLESR